MPNNLVPAKIKQKVRKKEFIRKGDLLYEKKDKKDLLPWYVDEETLKMLKEYNKEMRKKAAIKYWMKCGKKWGEDDD